MAKIQELCGCCWQGKDWLYVSGSADWELQVLVLELGEGCGGFSLGSTYPDDSQRIVCIIQGAYVCRLERELRSLF